MNRYVTGPMLASALDARDLYGKLGPPLNKTAANLRVMVIQYGSLGFGEHGKETRKKALYEVILYPSGVFDGAEDQIIVVFFSYDKR
ncbi:hypothetical protein STEG23_038063 [Scotinomys teguina]